MLSIVNGSSQAQETPVSGEPDVSGAAESPAEFEIVLGKRQVAGVLFLATVTLVVFSAVSYLAGKALPQTFSRKADSEPVAAPIPAAIPDVVQETPAPSAPVATIVMQPDIAP